MWLDPLKGSLSVRQAPQGLAIFVPHQFPSLPFASRFALHEPSTQLPEQGQNLSGALQQILSFIILFLLWF